MGCAECFFQDGRGYLEPLDERTPNVPEAEQIRGRVVRMNDGNDSNYQRDLVIAMAETLADLGAAGVFYNTAIPRLDFPGPVVLTANPGRLTDSGPAHLVDPCPPNLMFVRVRTNTWNLDLVDQVVEHYEARKVPVVLTFMAYYSDEPENHIRKSDELMGRIGISCAGDYTWRKRTLNSYWVITPAAWDRVVARYHGNSLVYTCGKDANTHACSQCGNCLREFFATRERMAAP